jgi:rubrerythrin
MASGSIEIRAPQDLLQALVKARKIEEAFEEVVHWQGFLTVKDTETGKLLGRLVRDSATHERLVDSLIRMIEPSAPVHQEARIAPIVVDGDDEMQFLQKLMEGEDLAYYVYSLILSELDHLDLKSIVGERNAVEFRRVLSELVSAERMHRELVSKLLAVRRPP